MTYKEVSEKIQSFKKDIKDVCIKHNLCITFDEGEIVIREYSSEYEAIQDAIIDHKIFENDKSM